MCPTALPFNVTTAESRTDIEVRQAVRADLLEIFRIERRSFGQPWPYAELERFLDSSGFLVAEDDAVVGYVVADTTTEPGVPIGHIKDLAVESDRRREGIGRMLLARALMTLASTGVRRVKLEVRRSNHEARSLYEAFGFEICDVQSGYYADGEDAYVMVRGT